ncbi:MAG TPA: hypothetical protein DCP28_05025, partial [Cytophagales bacterium]|nr:hypothetical protein [Cytophagales bacterium]
MTQEEFEQELSTQVDKLERWQVLAFAHSAAVLAVPLVFADGRIDFWTEEQRPNFRYHLLSTLDYQIIFHAALDAAR